MKINESEILRCGFTKLRFWNKKFETNLIISKAMGLTILDTIGKDYFHLCVEEYSSHLEGFIVKDISIYKCKGKQGKHIWVCVINDDDVFQIKKTDDIINISSVIEYKAAYGFVYVIYSPVLGYKIGSSRSIHNRNAVFNVKLPFEWNYYKIYVCENHSFVERKALHLLFDDKRMNKSEWFDLNQKDLNIIDQFMKLNRP